MDELNNKAYFLAGYIYAQAERIVQESSYPRMSEKEFRAEVQRMQKILTYDMVYNEVNKKEYIWKDVL